MEKSIISLLVIAGIGVVIYAAVDSAVNNTIFSQGYFQEGFMLLGLGLFLSSIRKRRINKVSSTTSAEKSSFIQHLLVCRKI